MNVLFLLALIVESAFPIGFILAPGHLIGLWASPLTRRPPPSRVSLARP